jgi:hypothetical protein
LGIEIKSIAAITLVLLSGIMVLGVLLGHRVEYVFSSANRRIQHTGGLPTLWGSISRGTHHHHWANTVVDAVIADAPEAALACPPRRTKALAPHDDRAEP